MKRPYLTKIQAEQFLAGEIADLRVFTSMDDAAAAILAKHQGALSLGVTELSHAAAEALAEHAGGSLYLERLKFLNEGAANALAFHKGSQYMAHDYRQNLIIGFCSDNDLRVARRTLRLGEGAAKALARGGTGRLSLSVAAVSDEEAESLAQLEHLLHLPRLKALTNSNLAHKLVHCEEGESEDVVFYELKTLSNEVATALSRFPTGCLYFEGLEAIADEVAETFTKALETRALGALYMLGNIPCSPHARRILLAGGAHVMIPSGTQVIHDSEKVLGYWVEEEGAMKAVRTVESIQQERAAKGVLFAAFRQELNLQVPLASLPLGKRPIHQLQSKPEVWNRFLAGLLKELGSFFGGHAKTQRVRWFDCGSHQWRCLTFGGQTATQRVLENLGWPADEVWSIQLGVSEAFSCLLHERGTRNLFASCLESTWVDAEALTEGDLRKVSNLCSKIAPDAHFDESYPRGAVVVTLGDEPCVLMQSLIGGGDQWEAPTHEISNLLNRRLFPQRVAIYLYSDGESGTYVIVERDRASEILKRIHALDKAVAARQKAEFLLPVECCAACGVPGVVVDEPPMRGCRECGRLMHERCLLIKVDLDANSDDWFRGAAPAACPFCSGTQVHPDDANFVNGYTLGLRQAKVRRLTLHLVKPLTAIRRADLDLRYVTRVDKDAATALCRQKGNMLLGSMEESTRELLKQRDGEVSEMVLTLRLANAFLKDRDEAKLKEFVTIEDAAAVALLKHRGPLHLEGLISLSDAAVSVLAKHKRALYLHGLEDLSDAAAITLATHGGSGLAIGITSLSDVAAQALASYSGCLRLVGLASLSDAAAKALAKHEGGDLALPCLRHASDVGLAALALHKGGLDLNGLLGEVPFLMKSSLRLRKVGSACEDCQFFFEEPANALTSLLRAEERTPPSRHDLAGYFCEMENERGREDCYAAWNTEGTPICDDLEVVIDEADHVHFLPFQFQWIMSVEDWEEASHSWDAFLGAAPLDEAARAGWQVCIPWAGFFGQPE